MTTSFSGRFSRDSPSHDRNMLDFEDIPVTVWNCADFRGHQRSPVK